MEGSQESSHLIQLSVAPNIALVEGFLGRHQPGHLCAAGQLAVDEDLDLRLGPSVVNVDDGQHVPPPWLELVLHTVLVALPFHLQNLVMKTSADVPDIYLHAGENQTVSDKVSRVSHAFTCLKTAGEKGYKRLVSVN